jgi:hypothetical protein
MVVFDLIQYPMKFHGDEELFIKGHVLILEIEEVFDAHCTTDI